jgi:hypothetical protein
MPPKRSRRLGYGIAAVSDYRAKDYMYGGCVQEEVEGWGAVFYIPLFILFKRFSWCAALSVHTTTL